MGILTVCLKQCGELGYHSGQDVRTFKFCQYTSSIVERPGRIEGRRARGQLGGLDTGRGIRSVVRRGWEVGGRR